MSGFASTPPSRADHAPPAGPAFDQAVPAGGYLWWYVDGISADGAWAISVIAFVGSVFSPYYAWSGRRDPLDHCCLNVALYDLGGGGGRWTMTERSRAAVARAPHELRLGPSALCWRHGELVITIDEWTAPLPTRVQGEIRVTPQAMPGRRFFLDAAGRHVWQPIAPRAALCVDLSRPGLNWRGLGYLDSNYGSEPLEAGFRHWSWSRAHTASGTIILYDAERSDGGATSLALGISAAGEIDLLPPLAPVALPPSRWRLARPSRADRAHAVRIDRTLVDAPFYARTLIETELYGEPALAFHESLSLDRFRRPLIQAILPFRMPRRPA